MNRFYHIIDNNGLVEYQSKDLPMIIGSESSANIKVNEKRRMAFIAESEGHLFIQPADSDSVIFHNDKILNTSQWIKSGDITRLEKYFLRYKISSDRVEIIVQEIPENGLEDPNQDNKSYLSEYHPKVIPQTSTLNDSVREIKTVQYRYIKYFIYSLLFLLLLIAGYLLMAKSVEIKVFPEADRIKLSGFPPPFELAGRFLAMPGEYNLEINKQGYKSRQQKVLVSNKENIFQLKLEKLPGKLKINFYPSIDQIKSPNKTEIVIDGQQYTGNPAQYIFLAPGEHEIQIRQKDYKEISETISIEGLGREQILDIEFQPDWGVLKVETIPVSAVIIAKKKTAKQSNLNSTVIESISPAAIKLLSGQYRITINKEHFRTVQKELAIKADEIVEWPPIILEPADAYISINTIADDIMVFIDGQFQENEKNRFMIDSDKQHTITISAAGYMDEEIIVKLQPDQEKTIEVNLKAELSNVFINTIPADTVLYIDNQRQSKNSGRFKMNTRQHTVEARAPGYISRTLNIFPNKKFSQKLDIVLQPVTSKSKSNTPNHAVKQKMSAQNSDSRYTTVSGNMMIPIKGGEFFMGSSRNEMGRRSNEKMKKINITQNFYLSEKEISNKQYRTYNASHNSGNAASQSLDHDMQPVVNVSWDQAARFCNWLSQKEGLEPYYQEIDGIMKASNTSSKGKINDGYRLPFESEWAYAGRVYQNKKARRYPWAGGYPPVNISGNFADESARTYLSPIIKGYNDNYIVSAPVGTFSRNAAGIYDMGGNVREWCHDYYTAGSNLNSSDAVFIDPRGPEKGRHHVIRDSSWRNAAKTELRLAYRTYSLSKHDDVGFRIARYAP